MSEILHLKYRPSSFDEMIEPEDSNLVDGLRHLINNDLAHSFIFHGPPGTGKTSAARVIANELGCSGHNASLLEIDAATYNGVDDIRNIISQLQIKSFGGDKRCLILDEAHRLSPAAWTALLKSIEEPQDSSYWFFCTTEIQKVPKNIQSRCQIFNFHDWDVKSLEKVIWKTISDENFDIEKDIVRYIAKNSSSPRQALVALARAVSLEDPSQIKNEILDSEQKESELIEICRFLAKGNLNWKKFTSLLYNLSVDDAETARYICLNYFTKCCLGTKKKDEFLYFSNLLDRLSQPYAPFNKNAKSYLIVAFGDLFDDE